MYLLNENLLGNQRTTCLGILFYHFVIMMKTMHKSELIWFNHEGLWGKVKILSSCIIHGDCKKKGKEKKNMVVTGSPRLLELLEKGQTPCT